MFQQRISFLSPTDDTKNTNLFVSFASSVFNRIQRRKTQKLFSCPSLEPLNISAHFCVFCGFNIFRFHVHFIFVSFVFSVGNPITMSDVSRNFFVPL